MGGVSRYFELRSNCALFFLSERDGEVQGCVQFGDSLVLIVDDESTRGRDCFDIITPEMLKYRLDVFRSARFQGPALRLCEN